MISDSLKIIHSRDWNSQYENFERYFRLKHDLQNLPAHNPECETISFDSQAEELSQMINASYEHEKIFVSAKDILQWKNHETFREDLCIYLKAEDDKMIASGIAEYDETCGEGILEWIQVLPEYRGRGLGKKIVNSLLNRLKKIGANFVTVSGNLDNSTEPIELYRKCGFSGDDVWYICQDEKRRKR